MLPNKITPIIWPLINKVFTGAMFMQQRPRYTGGRGVVVLPVLPWDASGKPPNGFGAVALPPTASSTLPGRFAMCRIVAPLLPSNIRLPAYSSQLTQPAVVHSLKPMPATKWRISGVTKDSAGTILPACVVDVFLTSSDVIQGSNVSNANGEYLIEVPTQNNHYAVAYKAGAPDVAGTTVNTLTAT